MYTILNMDVVAGLRSLPDSSIHVVVTSPPYWGLRRYAGVQDSIWGGDPAHDHTWGPEGRPSHPGQVEQTKWKDADAAGQGQTAASGTFCDCGAWRGAFGLEPSLDLYIQHGVEVFRELKRVLHPSGTFWLNVGDCYDHAGPQPSTGIHRSNGVPLPETFKRAKSGRSKKNLAMMPAKLAIALQEDGWILRQDIIWAKGLSFCPTYSGSVMPESIQDRAVWSHEHLFHFALKDKYYYDIEGNREPYAASTLKEAQKAYTGQATKEYDANGVQNPSDVKRRIIAKVRLDRDQVGLPSQMRSLVAEEGDRYMSGRTYPQNAGGRNLRNVWVIPKEPLKEAHFAAFPTKLVEPVIKLGSSEKGACPTCLNPWERVTHKEGVPQEIREAFEAARGRTEADLGRGDGYTHRKPNFRRRVLGEGWRPTCDCRAGDPVPARVLDPFSGSGRAGVVSVRLGRDYIGIDASAEYCAIATRLIEGVKK